MLQYTTVTVTIKNKSLQVAFIGDARNTNQLNAQPHLRAVANFR